MTNIRSIARILVVVAAGSTAAVALAQGPGYGQGPGAGPGYGHHHDRGPEAMGGQGPHHVGPGERAGGDHGKGMWRGRGERMARALGLTEEQRAKVRQIREDTRRKNWDALGQIRTERFKLREIMRADKIDPDAAVEQKRKVDDLKRQVMRARLEARNQVMALLTPEQRTRARALRPMFRGRRGNG